MPSNLGLYNDDGSDILTTITLNEYQRRNLMTLLNTCGYPDYMQELNYPNNPWIREECKKFNTGDWLGEIVIKLSREGDWCISKGWTGGCEPYYPKQGGVGDENNIPKKS